MMWKRSRAGFQWKMTDENTEGVNEEIVRAIVGGKKKELDAMEACGIFDVCEELARGAKVITTR